MLRKAFYTFAMLLLAASASYAATFNVDTTNDTQDVTPGDGICADSAGDCSLRAAITEANALAGDDVINVPAGTYTQSLVSANEDNNAGGDWDIRSNIVINGAGAATTIIQAAATPGTATERVMNVVLSTNVVEINGVTLRHGNKTGTAGTTTRGGGIRNVGTLTMNDCIVTENVAPGSAGIRNERAITLNNVTVSNNDCVNATSNCFGGGMYNTLAANSTVSINNSTFTGNTSLTSGTNVFGFGAGLGIESTSGFSLVITNSVFSNNVGTGTGTGGSNGNGIRVLASGASTANISDSVFSNNSGTGGSAIQGSGIQVFTSGTGTLTGSWDRITVSGNSANASAGVAFVATGGPMNITVRDSTISGNTATGNAGGMGASNSGATSGASNVISILNSTISGNTAGQNGGGLAVEQPAATGSVTVNLNFTTVANNTANSDNAGTEGGGGIFRSTAGVVNLKNSAVADNSVGTGGSGPDIFGSVNSQDYNHIEDLSGATITGTTTNNSTGPAMLGPLADNGGTTETHLPMAGSVLINAIPSGTNDCGTTVVTDQRGVARPSEGACEKGSVEIAGGGVTFVMVSGRLHTPSGKPISNALITLQGPGVNMTAQSGHFGTYYFVGVPTGQTYTLSVSDGKRFTFTPSSRQIMVTADMPNEDFESDNNLLRE